jgi:hypothetical protein
MRRVLVGTAAAVLVMSGGVASAAEDPAPGGDEGWEPVPEEYYASVEVEACGSVVTIDSGDVREVEQRSEELDDGTVFTEYRGGQTVDLTRESDGAMIDELDISGPAWDLLSADGTEVLVELEGPSLIWSGNEVERAAADEEGLPYLTYFEEGSVLFRVELDPATGESTAVDGLRLDAEVVDLCDLLDEAADDSDDSDDSGHGKRDD